MKEHSDLKNEISTKVTKSSIVIHIPIGLLSYSQKMRPEEPYRITNKHQMAKWIAENILDYCSDIGNSEIGASDFTVLLDRLFTEACESAETWLEPIDWEEE